MDEDIQRYWDQQVATFDEEPDHGLADPPVRLAWSQLLRRLLPSPSADIIDLGCGTGSLSVLLAEQGRRKPLPRGSNCFARRVGWY